MEGDADIAKDNMKKLLLHGANGNGSYAGMNAVGV